MDWARPQKDKKMLIFENIAQKVRYIHADMHCACANVHAPLQTCFWRIIHRSCKKNANDTKNSKNRLNDHWNFYAVKIRRESVNKCDWLD